MTFREKIKSAAWWKRVAFTWLLFTVLSVLIKLFIFTRPEPFSKTLLSAILTGFFFSIFFHAFNIIRPGNQSKG